MKECGAGVAIPVDVIHTISLVVVPRDDNGSNQEAIHLIFHSSHVALALIKNDPDLIKSRVHSQDLGAGKSRKEIKIKVPDLVLKSKAI